MKTIITGLLFLLTLTARSQLTDGAIQDRASAVRCYRCTGVTDPGLCSNVVTCQSDEECFVERIQKTGLADIYNMGCIKQGVCNFMKFGGPVVGRKRDVDPKDTRDLSRRDVIKCRHCCTSNQCNHYLCGSEEAMTIEPTHPIYVRLIGDPNAFEGTVEVYYHGQWGAICDDNWSAKDAVVVCNMLGYSGTGAAAVGRARYTQSKGRIWLENVNCRGTETSLWECPHGLWGSTDCSHTEDAGVLCPSVTPVDDAIFLLDTGFGGLIFRMSLRTESYVLVPIDTDYTPASLDYDPVEGRLYFVDPRYRQVLSAHYDGTDIRELKQLDLDANLEKSRWIPLLENCSLRIEEMTS